MTLLRGADECFWEFNHQLCRAKTLFSLGLTAWALYPQNEYSSQSSTKGSVFVTLCFSRIWVQNDLSMYVYTQ